MNASIAAANADPTKAPGLTFALDVVMVADKPAALRKASGFQHEVTSLCMSDPWSHQATEIISQEPLLAAFITQRRPYTSHCRPAHLDRLPSSYSLYVQPTIASHGSFPRGWPDGSTPDSGLTGAQASL